MGRPLMSKAVSDKPTGMTKADALAFRDSVIALCKKHGVWYEIFETNKPCLRDIVLTTSIKVSEK